MKQNNEGLVLHKKSLGKAIFYTYSERPDIAMMEVQQVHGTKICLNKDKCEADGIIINNNEGRPLAIKTADCIPLAVMGEKGIGLIHIGWRGLKNQIHLSQILKEIKPLFFYIGPHISAKAFEVTREFLEYFPGETQYFREIDQRFYFSLEEKLKSDLRRYYPKAVVEQSGLCTFSNKEFHSYRRDQTPQRNWNLLIPTQDSSNT